jgi:hypothetical protein
VILPGREVRYEILADLARAIDPCVGVEQLPCLDAVERHKGNREQGPAAPAALFLARAFAISVFTQLLVMLASLRISKSLS